MPKMNNQRSNRGSDRSRRVGKFSLLAIGILALLFSGFYLIGPRESSLANEGTDQLASTEADSNQAEAKQRRMQLSDLLFEQRRHVKGDLAAPITIIEFSDFQ
jgi:hypothetical protein